MTRPTQVYVDIGSMKSRLDRWCASRGLTLSEGVRCLVAAAVEEEGEPSQLPAGRERTATTRINIRLTPVELAEVVRLGRAGGFLNYRWIVALVRAHLTGEPQPGEREMQLLAASNQQLAMIRMQLGMLLRGGYPDTPCEIEAVRAVIGSHLQMVNALLRANLERWGR